MEYIIKIIVFFCLGFLVFCVYTHYYRYEYYPNEKPKKSTRKKYHFKIKKAHIFLWIIAILFGVYAMYCGSPTVMADRGKYELYFERENETYFLNNSYGLYIIVKILHAFTHDANVFFFFMMFFVIIAVAMAIEAYEDKTPICFLMVACGMQYVYGFYMLKQVLALPISAMAIAYFFQKKYKQCILLVGLAIMFHETSIILLPLMLIFVLVERFPNFKYVLVIGTGVLLLGVNILIKPMMAIVSQIIPDIAAQLTIYLTEDGSLITSDNFATIIKGAPYYLIAIYATLRRKSLRQKINNYDNFLIMAWFTSIMTLLSAQMYWFWRIAAIGYIPTYVLMSLIYKYDSKRRSVSIVLYSSIALLFVFTFRYLFQVYFNRGGF